MQVRPTSWFLAWLLDLSRLHHPERRNKIGVDLLLSMRQTYSMSHLVAHLPSKNVGIRAICQNLAF